MNHSLPSLNALRAFEAVARHLNYHAAAEELKVTPAAVKRLVGRLEDAIGSPLLKRQGRGLVLTSTGYAGLEDLAQGMAKLKSSVEKMREADSSKPLIITVEPSFSSAWLVPELAHFRAQHPDITVLIDSSAQVVDLKRNNVDIAIRYGVPSDNELEYYRLFQDIILPACSPAVAEQLPLEQGLGALRSASLIHWDTSGLTAAESSQRWFVWKNWLSSFGAEGVASHDGLHFSEYSQALQAAIAGQGVILVSEPILKTMFHSGLLTCPFQEKATPDAGYDVVVTREALERPEVQIFVEWICQTAGQND